MMLRFRSRHITRRFGAAMVLSSLTLGMLAAAPVSAGAPRTRWVDDDGHAGGSAGCASSRAAKTTIQAAINVSGVGDTVRVCPGTYHEVVTVNVQGLTLEGVVGLKAKIVPPENDTATAGFPPAVVAVTANHVTVRNLNVIVPDTCQYYYTGIFMDHARHARVLHNRVAERGSTTTTCGLEIGAAFFASDGEIANNVIRSYAQVGIDVSESSVSVHDNSLSLFQAGCLTAVCATGLPSPTGIFVYHASAAVDHNTISVDATTGSVSFSAGIAFYQDLTGDGNVVSVTYNAIRGAGYGVLISGSNGTVDWNTIRDSTVTGIAVSASSNLKIRHNRVRNGGGAGIDLVSDTTGNSVRNNNFSGNDGTDCVDESSGPANTWVNNLGDESTPSGICTPAP